MVSTTRTRFAPSPTGELHLGGLRTALFAYLLAKKNNGQCILRIEDTDLSRQVPNAVEGLIRSLSWAGLKFDESPTVGGKYGPYVQSERFELYQKFGQQLLEQKHAYHCFCSPEELNEIRADLRKRSLPPRYDGRCRRLSTEQVQNKLRANQPFVVRMKIVHTEGSYYVQDEIRGTVEFKPKELEDQVILKSDGLPTYHLANVVDDHLMKISHVIRGEEWLPSTPKHLQLYRYFGWTPPKFAHLPLLLNTDKSKLSKRQGDVSVEAYQQQGYLQQTLINFIALLGWSPKDGVEIFSFEKLIQSFDLDRVGKAGAVFDVKKLQWMNQKYIQTLPADELLQQLKNFWGEKAQQELSSKMQRQIAVLCQPSLVRLSDIQQHLPIFYLTDFQLTDPQLVQRLKNPVGQQLLQSFINHLPTSLDEENFKALLKEVQKSTGIGGKDLWSTLRLAITAAEHGPELPKIAAILGVETCRQRVEHWLH